jgi:hypothetical protein
MCAVGVTVARGDAPAVGVVMLGVPGCVAPELPAATGEGVCAAVDVEVAVLVGVGVEVGVGLIQLTGQCAQISVAV